METDIITALVFPLSYEGSGQQNAEQAHRASPAFFVVTTMIFDLGDADAEKTPRA